MAELNPYAAPQTIHVAVPRAQYAENEQRQFPSSLVWQALRKGANAGLIASLAMVSVFAWRMGEGSRGELARLLVICGWFIAATSALGLFWGLNHAVIVWCLRRWRPEAWN